MIYKPEQEPLKKADEDPIDPAVKYTQNILISYLLKRVPKTFAVAVRILTEIKYKYPDFKPESFIDFGAGLCSASTAFIDLFGESGQVYAVEPVSRMRKLSKYLTEDVNIQFYDSLGSLSAHVAKADIVYVGHVLNQLNSDYV